MGDPEEDYQSYRLSFLQAVGPSYSPVVNVSGGQTVPSSFAVAWSYGAIGYGVIQPSNLTRTACRRDIPEINNSGDAKVPDSICRLLHLQAAVDNEIAAV